MYETYEINNHSFIHSGRGHCRDRTRRENDAEATYTGMLWTLGAAMTRLVHGSPELRLSICLYPTPASLFCVLIALNLAYVNATIVRSELKHIS